MSSDQIVVTVSALFGVFFLIQGFIGFNNGHIQVYIGRRRRKKLIAFSGPISDVLSILSVLAGAIALIGAFAYFTGAASIMIAIIPFAITVIVFQAIAVIANLVRRLR
ncbi:MAG: hypothetical protein AAF490_26630 [Chloroflexota bacterium]